VGSTDGNLQNWQEEIIEDNIFPDKKGKNPFGETSSSSPRGSLIFGTSISWLGKGNRRKKKRLEKSTSYFHLHV